VLARNVEYNAVVIANFSIISITDIIAMRLLLRLLINAVAIWVATLIVPNVEVSGGWLGWVIVVVLFALVNTFIRPIAQFFSLPLTILTLGIFALIVNALLLMFVAWLAGDYFQITGSNWLSDLGWAFLASIVISLVSTVLGWFLPDRDR
jgi:putative membrane protein